uniref:Uncharacterized protein n=1 Tax=Arundo donax TaxID=35708 RepID=A0A0A9F7Y3_ARUDO
MHLAGVGGGPEAVCAAEVRHGGWRESVRGDVLLLDDLGGERIGDDVLGGVGGLAAVELVPVEAEEDGGVDDGADKRGGEDAEDELAEGDPALDGDDEVLRVADGRGGGSDVGAGREREEERLGRQVVLARDLEDELGKHDAAGVVGEERGGERGDGAGADQEVAPAMAPPREQPAQVAEHVGALKVDAHHHGAEEEAQDGKVHRSVRLVSAHHAQQHHEHGAQQRTRRATDRKERHRREHRQHPEDAERRTTQRNLHHRLHRHYSLTLPSDAAAAAAD